MLDEDVDWATLDLGKFALYGTTLTLAIDALLYPLELVKTRLQVEATSRVTLVRAATQTAAAVVRAEGARGLYRGFGLYAVGGLPSQGAYFLGYRWAKDKLAATSWCPPAAVPLVAGLMADVLASPLWTPVDVIASRMQIQGGSSSGGGGTDAAPSSTTASSTTTTRYRNTGHAVRVILRTEGVAGLFRGLGAQIATFGPASALWWWLYEVSHDALGAWSRRRPLTTPLLTTLTKPPPHPAGPPAASSSVSLSAASSPGSTATAWWVPAASGVISGALSSIVTNPLDIAKTRLQTQHQVLWEYLAAMQKGSGRPAVAAAAASVVPVGGLTGSGGASAASAATKPHTHRGRHARRLVFNRHVAAVREMLALHAAGGSGHKQRHGHKQQSAAGATSSASGTTSILSSQPATTQSAPPSITAAAGKASTAAAKALLHTPTTGAAGSHSSAGSSLPSLVREARRSLRRNNIPVVTAKAAVNAAAVAATKVATAAHRAATRVNAATGAHIPFLGFAPFQASVSRTVAFVAESAAAIRAAIAELEHRRIGIARRADRLQHASSPAGAGASTTAAAGRAAARGGAMSGRYYPSAAPSPRLHSGMFDILLHMWQTEGPRSYLRGVVPRMAFSACASAFTFWGYEEVVKRSRKDATVADEGIR